MKGVGMPKHAKNRPARGNVNRAVGLDGAAVSNSTEHEQGVHPAHAKCDPPHHMGDKLVALVGVLAVLTLSTVALIALHRWGVDDSQSVQLLGLFAITVIPQQS